MRPALGSALMWALLAAWAPCAVAQTGGRSGYVLYRVASAAGPFFTKFKAPTLIQADANGGRAVADLAYNRCNEQVEFTWRFDKDIRYLQPEEALTMTMASRIEGNCGRDHYAQPTTAIIVPEINRTLADQERRELKGMAWAPQQTDAESRVWARTRGTGSVTFRSLGVPRGPGRMYFGITLTANTDLEEFHWQAIYMYQAVFPATPPGETTITSDTPGASSPTTASVPPPAGGAPSASGAPAPSVGTAATPPIRTLPPPSRTPAVPMSGSTPAAGPASGRDPCQSPQVQACVDQWLDRFVAVLNQRAPERGPWSTSRYGQLLNSGTRSVTQPEGWDTTYRRTKQCFVWTAYARSHDDPILGGAMPALQQQCGGGVVPSDGATPSTVALPRTQAPRTPSAAAAAPPPRPPTTPIGRATSPEPALAPVAVTPPDGAACPDSSVQACVDQWLDKFVLLLNRQVADRAPWSISQYGHLVNSLTRSVAPPDGWETTYERRRECFVWAAYAQAHEEPALGGELLPLHQQCPGTLPGPTSAEVGSPPTPVGQPGVSGRTLLAERRTAETGQPVIVPVRLLEPSGLAKMNFEVTYDTTTVRVERVTAGSLLGPANGFDENSQEPGRIRIGFVEPGGLSTSGIVANLTLRAIGQPGSRTSLTLMGIGARDSSTGDLPMNLMHGDVTITGPGGRVPGDCDGDGLMTAADALCALKMSVGLLPADRVMDANGDQQVTSGDTRTILQRIP